MECVITHGPNGLWDVCFLCQAHNFNVYTNVHQHRHRPESYMYKCAHVCRSVGFILFRRNQTRRNVCKLRVVTSVAFFFSLPLQFNTRNVQISLLLWWKIAHFHTPRSNNYDLLIFFSTCSKKKSKKIVHKVGFVNHLQHDFIVTKMNAHKHVEITCQWTKRKKNRYGMS